MKMDAGQPPREFTVGRDRSITLRDCGAVRLEVNELVTFITGPRGEDEQSEEPFSAFDVTRTPFGYYATNSLNGSLPKNGLRPALSRNAETGRAFVLLVHPDKLAEYEAYLASEAMVHLGWLDTMNATALPAKSLNDAFGT